MDSTRPNAAATASPSTVPAHCVITATPWGDIAKRLESTAELLEQATAGLASSSDSNVTRSAPTCTLTVIIPVFNERETLPVVLQRTEEVMPADAELIIVDDGSTDGTCQWLQQLPASPRRKVICRRRNHGKGSAVRLGIRHSQGDVVAIQDADLEYDPFDLLDVIKPIAENRADVVYGSRYLRQSDDPSVLHRFGNWLLTALSNRLTGLKLTDMETCHKAFRGDLIRSIPLRECRFGFEPEITAKIAARKQRVLEVPTGYECRGYDEGKKIGWRDGIAALACMWRYRPR
ncbi:glycosyltransferase family 2 protein [Stieleria varia]|uniref:Undecaprenyl-phosphate mannosyltransferase n=1 Tax=Stieleria varia TaxID=2528005 RepID=A0A5C6AZQ9_9BACT|nr:glycosyltransferase family 2 protein [Stieleria varia]TWU05453.1 Undecaprenyl-phosphate mannosyltransferase [Stieleria varia]